MNIKANKVRDTFYIELSATGDIWRILRRGTLMDLITLSFFSFQKENSKNHLIDIFNYCMKVKLLSRIKSIEVEGSLDDFF